MERVGEAKDESDLVAQEVKALREEIAELRHMLGTGEGDEGEQHPSNR